MSKMAVWKERLGGTGFRNADQPEHWAWTDQRWLMHGLRCAELKGAGLGSEVLGWLGYTVRREAQARMRSRLVGSKALAKEALARRPLVKKIATGQRGAGQKGADICADICP